MKWRWKTGPGRRSGLEIHRKETSCKCGRGRCISGSVTFMLMLEVHRNSFKVKLINPHHSILMCPFCICSPNARVTLGNEMMLSQAGYGTIWGQNGDKFRCYLILQLEQYKYSSRDTVRVGTSAARAERTQVSSRSFRNACMSNLVFSAGRRTPLSPALDQCMNRGRQQWHWGGWHYGFVLFIWFLMISCSEKRPNMCFGI